MYRTMQMEQFSIAYVKAVAAIAGCNTYRYAVDDDIGTYTPKKYVCQA